MSRRLIWHKEEIEEVIDILLEAKTRKEIEDIFDKLLTPREINDIARRYNALVLINEGCSYSDIIQKTGMSPITISRLSNKCGYGFRKSLGIKKPSGNKKTKDVYKTIKYKGVPIMRVKK